MSSPDQKNLLILDLDETLIFGTTTELNRQSDMVALGYLIYFRPGLANFISHVASLYKLAVWTSASRSYALEICSAIFPSSTPLEFIWASERCTTQWDYETGQVCGAKRLNKLRKKYPLERVLMVDDSPEKHLKNFGNLVRVVPFEGDTNDRELNALSVYLDSLATCTNVRVVEKRHWRSQIKQD